MIKTAKTSRLFPLIHPPHEYIGCECIGCDKKLLNLSEEKESWWGMNLSDELSWECSNCIKERQNVYWSLN